MQGQPPSAEGIHVSAIARAVGGNAVTIRYVVIVRCHLCLTWSSCSDALDKLTDDGVVYSGADESHFLLC